MKPVTKSGLIDSKFVTKQLLRYLVNLNNKFVVPNVYYYHWESDVFCVTQSNYVHEFEIKTNEKDFLNDFKKAKHSLLNGDKQAYIQRKGWHYSWNKEYGMPNRFTFVLPEDVATCIELPDYCGLIRFRYNETLFNNGCLFGDIRKAPKLHGTHFAEDWENLAKKIMYKLM